MSFTGFMVFARRAPIGACAGWRVVAALGIAATMIAIGAPSRARGAQVPEGWMVVEYVHPDDWSCVASEPCVDCTNTAAERSELRVRRRDGGVRAHLVDPGARVRICAGGGA